MNLSNSQSTELMFFHEDLYFLLILDNQLFICEQIKEI